jgi:hypothetical protein
LTVPLDVTASYRRALLAIQAQLIARILKIWPDLDIEDLRNSWPAVEAALMALIRQHSAVSSSLAAAYYAAARTESGITSAFSPVIAEPFPEEQLRRALISTGLIRAYSDLKNGATSDEATTGALAGVIGASSRLVLNASRETVQASIKVDRRAVGWQRVASPNACEFCVSIVDEGMIGKEDSLAFEAHDHCGCTSEPAFG